MIHGTGFRAEGFLPHHTEVSGQASVEVFLCIAEIQIVSVAEEPLDHRIVGRDEFNDQIGLEAGEPLDQVWQRNVPADGQMVDEGEAQDQVRADLVPRVPGARDRATRGSETDRQRLRATARSPRGARPSAHDTSVRPQDDPRRSRLPNRRGL